MIWLKSGLVVGSGWLSLPASASFPGSGGGCYQYWGFGPPLPPPPVMSSNEGSLTLVRYFTLSSFPQLCCNGKKVKIRNVKMRPIFKLKLSNDFLKTGLNNEQQLNFKH